MAGKWTVSSGEGIAIVAGAIALAIVNVLRRFAIYFREVCSMLSICILHRPSQDNPANFPNSFVDAPHTVRRALASHTLRVPLPYPFCPLPHPSCRCFGPLTFTRPTAC